MFVILFAAVLLAIGHGVHPCGITNISMQPNRFYQLTSPGFPRPYPSYYQSCLYTATAPANHRVFMYCDTFDIYASYRCRLAGVMISKSGDIHLRDGVARCGRVYGLTFITSGNRFVLKFYNGIANYYRNIGFSCKVVAFPISYPNSLTTKPVIKTLKPVDTTLKPVVTTQKPVVTTQKPVVTTLKPVVTTQKPVVTTHKPVVTTKKPVVTTQKPVVTTQKPVVTTLKPVVTTQKPVVTTQKPVVTTQKPVATTQVTDTPTTSKSLAECGKKNKAARIIGGVETDVNEYPWIASIETIDGRPFCGGSLIANQWVLTASHCLEPFLSSSLRVTLGEHDLTTGEETASITTLILETIIHPNYNISTVDNDIALIKLKDPVTFSKKISPVCLPYGYENDDLHGKSATVIGWGQTTYQGTTSNTLKELVLQVVSKEQCQKFASVSKLLTDNMFCTYNPDKDACRGDSGGPLMYEKNDLNYVIGVISWGIQCAATGKPGVYAKVANYLDWIEKETKLTFIK